MTNLDERARSASSALLDEVDRSTARTWASPRPSHRATRAFALIAILALAVGVVVLARQSRTSGTKVGVGGPASDGTSRSSPVPEDTIATQWGTFAGYSYVVYTEASASVGIEFVGNDGSPLGIGTGDGSSTLEAPGAWGYGFNERFLVLYGKAPTLVDRVRLTLDSGDSVEGPVEEVSGQPFRMFALELETRNAAVDSILGGTATFLAADGTEVAQQLFLINHGGTLCANACGSNSGATSETQPTTTAARSDAAACKSDRDKLQAAEEAYFSQHATYASYPQLVAEHFVADPGPEPLHTVTVGPTSTGNGMSYTITATGKDNCTV